MTLKADRLNYFLPRNFLLRSLALVIAGLAAILIAMSARAQVAQSDGSEFAGQEIIDAGHEFFGATSGGIATVFEKAFQTYGLPNGYILGQEGSGAFIAGATYGEGMLYTKNSGDHMVYWQGPSIGWDYGGEGARTMMLVYNLDSISGLYKRFIGVSGSAYIVGGAGMTVLRGGAVYLVPVRTGVGARLGINIGYLKLTPTPTWNPF